MNAYKPTPEEESAQRRADNDREGQAECFAALAASEEAMRKSASPAKVVDAVATGSGAPSAWVWECPKCKTEYPSYCTRPQWKKRGHCAKCEVKSWSPETLAETKDALSKAWPAIARSLTSDQHPNTKVTHDPLGGRCV